MVWWLSVSTVVVIGWAIVPGVFAGAGQSIELVRSPHIVGVSMLFLILAVVNQGLWLTWAILLPDIGTTIAATITGIITSFNLIWWTLRVLGLGPLLAVGGPANACEVWWHSAPRAFRGR